VSDKLADSDTQAIPEREVKKEPQNKFVRSVWELFFDDEIINDDVAVQKG
jgi:hypothetical protein